MHPNVFPSTQAHSAVLTSRQAAAHLGFSDSFLRKGRMTGARVGRAEPPPHIVVGKAIRYLSADLDAWLYRQRKVPRAPSILGQTGSMQ